MDSKYNDFCKTIIDHVNSNTWPFTFAEEILKKINYRTPSKGYVLFETGYGPSGLPHIGTFGENFRTALVRQAFHVITAGEIPTKLFCVSDDMDGLRKIPEFVKDKERFNKYIGMPLSAIPSPFGDIDTNSLDSLNASSNSDFLYEDWELKFQGVNGVRYTHSFAAAMNVIMKDFLDKFGFQYEFISATHHYMTGRFNPGLKAVMNHYDEIMAIMLPTLGVDRRETYCPFLPICQNTGRVLQVPAIALDRDNYTMTYSDPDTQENVVTSVLDGKCKLQWKPDFGMRWALFEVDYEMYGKDHLVNGKIYSKICQTLGTNPPYQAFYELFLDVAGKKVSKSKGPTTDDDVTLEKWLMYAPIESVSMFMYNSPQRAKKISMGLIPKMTDEYLDHLSKFHAEKNDEKDNKELLNNPVWHIHNGAPPNYATDISYSLLLNLVSAASIDDPEVVWGYIDRMRANRDKDCFTDDNKANLRCSFIDSMIRGVINYYNDFIAPYKSCRDIQPDERPLFNALLVFLRGARDLSANEMQNGIYQIAKNFNYDPKSWFTSLYEVILGASNGPRFGHFIGLYGLDKMISLIESKLSI